MKTKHAGRKDVYHLGQKSVFEMLNAVKICLTLYKLGIEASNSR